MNSVRPSFRISRHALRYLLALTTTALALSGAGFRAGTAAVRINPELPFWLSGYAARTHAANAVSQDLWAKALALDDGKGSRIVIVTTDVIGLPREVSDRVALRCTKELRLKREQLWLNSAHTHAGPVVWPILPALFELSPADTQRTKAYADHLTDLLVRIVADSLHNLAPAEAAYGSGTASFAINRRAGRFRDLDSVQDARAPVDHSVPVIRITGPDGAIRAILFGYACHNTTLTEKFYEISGDYAGYAQAALERTYPGSQAMFVMLCGADQNPSPRSELKHAEQHGSELAAAVEGVLASRMKTLSGPLRTAYRTTQLRFAPHSRTMFEEEAKGVNAYKARRARLMLERYNAADSMTSIVYPVQAVRFGQGLTIVTLGGEVVVDYALRMKREHPNLDLFVAGYSNDVMSYIPSLRVLREGGYEAQDSMIYYGRPGSYTESVEEEVFEAIGRVLAKVGVRGR